MKEKKTEINFASIIAAKFFVIIDKNVFVKSKVKLPFMCASAAFFFLELHYVEKFRLNL